MLETVDGHLVSNQLRSVLPVKKIDYQGSKSWLYPKTLQNSLQATRSQNQLHSDISQFKIS